VNFDPTPKACVAEGCEESFVPHRWAPESQSGSGWFHQRNGTSWCPAHVPEWVAGWREKQKEKK